MNILVLNGPNLNLLGTREPEIYGRATLADLEQDLRAAFPEVQFSFFQSNHEGALVERLHQAHQEDVEGVVFNPAAYTHTSVALRDAVAAITPPVIEVHMSNVYAREAMRHTSYIAPVAAGKIVGFGRRGYHLAVRYLVDSAQEGAK